MNPAVTNAIYRKRLRLVYLPRIALAHENPKNTHCKTSNQAYTMLLVQGRISQNIYIYMAFYEPIGCVRHARYYSKMYSRHLFSAWSIWDRV